MIKVDFYGKNGKPNGIRIFSNDTTGKYWGYLYKDLKIIGDFSADNSQEIENRFSYLNINWD